MRNSAAIRVFGSALRVATSTLAISEAIDGYDCGCGSDQDVSTPTGVNRLLRLPTQELGLGVRVI